MTFWKLLDNAKKGVSTFRKGAIEYAHDDEEEIAIKFGDGTNYAVLQCRQDDVGLLQITQSKSWISLVTAKATYNLIPASGTDYTGVNENADVNIYVDKSGHVTLCTSRQTVHLYTAEPITEPILGISFTTDSVEHSGVITYYY